LLTLGCGPAVEVRRLTVRDGYTTEAVIAAFEARYDLAAAKTAPGKVTIEGDERVFSSLSQAVTAAPDDAIIRVGAGLYHDAVVVAGKRLQIQGEGPDKTTLLARETALYLSRSDVSVSGIRFVSLSVGADASVTAVSESQARLSDCRFEGGTGPGMLVAGRTTRVSLVGNVFTGNMGGGIRIQGGAIKLRRNVIVRNAVGGIVMAPAQPGAIEELWVWHDTVLDNWSGRRCVSFAKAGVVPVTPLDNYRIEGAILNSGGLGEVFSEDFYGNVKQTGRNFISPAALPAPDFFVAPEKGDYRPRGAIVKDELGIELGAFPSEAGMADVTRLFNNALVSEKLQLAYVTSLFLPSQQRQEAHDRIQQVLFGWVGDFLKTKRLGTRLFAALGLARVAPEHWRLEVILAKFLEGFIERYTYALKPLNFFPENPEFGKLIESHLKGRTSFIPRFVVSGEDRPQAYVLSGRVTKPLVTLDSVKYFEVPRTVANPYHDKIKAAAGMLESRLVEQQRKIDDIQFTLTNPHFTQAQKNTRHRQNLEKKKVRLEEEREKLAGQLKDLTDQLASSAPTFELVVKGHVSEAEVRGSIFATMVLAPAGKIMMDTTEALSFRRITLTVQPLPEFGYQGASIVPAENAPQEQAARSIAENMLRSLIRAETAELRRLLDSYASGIITNDDEDKLVELLLLNAELYRKALEVQQEYETLKRSFGQPVEPLQVKVGYDERRGVGRQGVTVDVQYADVAAQNKRFEELETLYKPYWELSLQVDNFLKTRYGINQKLFFQTREIFERMVSKKR
jgi:hypothetical protein